MARSLSLAARFAVLTFLFHTVHSTCYFPDGSSDDRQKQCTSGGTSNCCAEGMQCLSNGFCNDARYNNFERVLRGACTDKSWGSGCQQTCTSIWKKGDEAVHYCGNGKACCGRSDSCCGDSSVSKFDFGNPTVIAVAGDSVAQQPQQQPQQQQDQPSQSQQSQQEQQSQPQTQQQQQQQTQASPSSTKQEQQQSPQQSAKQDEQKDAPSPTKNSDSPPSSKTNAPDSPSSKAPSSSDATTSSGEDDTSPSTSNKNGNPSAPATVITMITGPSTTFASTITSAPADPNATNNVTNNYINSNTTNNTVVIAVGVGVGLLVLLLALAVAACWWVRRKRRSKQPSMRTQKVAGAAGVPGDVGTEYFEIDGGGGQAEMATVGVGADAELEDRKIASTWGRRSGAVFEMEGSRGIELPEVGRDPGWRSDEKRL